MLEELLALGHKGAEYDAWLIRIGRRPVRQRLCRRQPELQDSGADGPQRAEADPGVRVRLDPDLSRREVRRLPADRTARTRAECLSWLFWQMGSAPYLGGGFGHFYAYAPTKIEYAIDRFAMEVKRQLDVLDRRLADNEYLAGSEYTIADIAVWPWYGGLAKGLVVWRRRIPVRAGLQERAALDRCDRQAPGRASAAAWSTASRAIPPASCTSATTPAISRPRRRTRSENRPRRNRTRRNKTRAIRFFTLHALPRQRSRIKEGAHDGSGQAHHTGNRRGGDGHGGRTSCVGARGRARRSSHGQL